MTDLKVKYREEVNSQKHKRKRTVVMAALKVFEQRGIKQTKMTDVADEAQVGVASVYRYFKTKTELVIQVGEYLLSRELVIYQRFLERELENCQTGFDEVGVILKGYLHLFDHQKDFIRFIESFDNYLSQEQVDPERLGEYDKMIGEFRKSFETSIKKGEEDGSLRRDINYTDFYTSMSQTLMGLAEKLVSRAHLIPSDLHLSSRRELEMIIDMALYYIENKEALS